MIELIELLNNTSGLRVVLYLIVFIFVLAIITDGIVNIIEAIVKIFKNK